MRQWLFNIVLLPMIFLSLSSCDVEPLVKIFVIFIFMILFVTSSSWSSRTSCLHDVDVLGRRDLEISDTVFMLDLVINFRTGTVCLVIVAMMIMMVSMIMMMTMMMTTMTTTTQISANHNHSQKERFVQRCLQ